MLNPYYFGFSSDKTRFLFSNSLKLQNNRVNLFENKDLTPKSLTIEHL